MMSSDDPAASVPPSSSAPAAAPPPTFEERMAATSNRRSSAGHGAEGGGTAAAALGGGDAAAASAAASAAAPPASRRANSAADPSRRRNSTSSYGGRSLDSSQGELGYYHAGAPGASHVGPVVVRGLLNGGASDSDSQLVGGDDGGGMDAEGGTPPPPIAEFAREGGGAVAGGSDEEEIESEDDEEAGDDSGGESGRPTGRRSRRPSTSSLASINILRDIASELLEDTPGIADDDRSVGHLKRWGDAELESMVRDDRDPDAWERAAREGRERVEREEREARAEAERLEREAREKLARRAEAYEKERSDLEQGGRGGKNWWSRERRKRKAEARAKRGGKGGGGKVMPAGAPRSEAKDQEQRHRSSSVHAAVSVSDKPPLGGPGFVSSVGSASSGSKGGGWRTNTRLLRCLALTFLLTVVGVTTYFNTTELPLHDFYARTGLFGMAGGEGEEADGSGEGDAVAAAAGAENPEGGIDYTGDKAWVPEGTDMRLDARSFPLVLENTLLDVYGPSSTPPAGTESVTPVFFHVPQGGLVAERVMVGCWGLTSAYNGGNMLGGGDGGETLEVLVDERNDNKYVNVNMMTPTGVTKAADLDLIRSGLTDVVITPHLHVAAGSVLSPEHRGRMSAMLRHPVERAVATYHLLTSAPDSPAHNAQVAQMSLEQYADSAYMERDWLTRFLSEAGAGSPRPVTDQHARVAKEVLRRKTLVGLYDRADESLSRMEGYYGWNKGKGEPNDQAIRCRREALAFEDGLRAQLPTVAEGDPAWEAIVRVNRFDMEVYEYALSLWEEQDGLHYMEP